MQGYLQGIYVQFSPLLVLTRRFPKYYIVIAVECFLEIVLLIYFLTCFSPCSYIPKLPVQPFCKAQISVLFTYNQTHVCGFLPKYKYSLLRLRRITQTKALIILAIMRKPNPIIVLLNISSTNSSFQAKHCILF